MRSQCWGLPAFCRRVFPERIYPLIFDLAELRAPVAIIVVAVVALLGPLNACAGIQVPVAACLNVVVPNHGEHLVISGVSSGRGTGVALRLRAFEVIAVAGPDRQPLPLEDVSPGDEVVEWLKLMTRYSLSRNWM